MSTHDLLKQLVGIQTESFKILTATNTSSSTTISGSSATGALTIKFDSPISLDPTAAYKLEILNMSFVPCHQNVNASNNKLYYIEGSTNKVLTIPPGSYEFNEIFDYIKAAIPNLTFSMNYNTTLIHVTVPATFSLRCVPEQLDNIMWKMMGFTSNLGTLISGNYDAANIGSISDLDVITIRCNQIRSAMYENGRKTNGIYSFTYGALTVNQVNQFQKASGDLFYLLDPVARLSQIDFYMVDQDGDVIDGNYELTVQCRISKVREGSGSDSL